MTMSISCSTARCASNLLALVGRLNCNGIDELSVTIPSYCPPVPIVPSSNIAGGVFSPRARPFALVPITVVDNAVVGRLAIATLSLTLVASALIERIQTFQPFHGLADHLLIAMTHGRLFPSICALGSAGTQIKGNRYCQISSAASPPTCFRWALWISAWWWMARS